VNDPSVDHLTPMNQHRPRAAFALLALAFALGACNSAEGPPVPGGVTAVSGNSQFAVVSSPAANPLVVLVTDQNGSPLPDTPVAWTVTSGGGSVANALSNSDASGIATMTYTAGDRIGAATVVATVAQIWTAPFTIYIEAP
jgi:Bacterial Ig-like domain (group 1)